MKRHPSLLSLSRDHYAALKLARDARQAVLAGHPLQIQTQARRVADVFAAEFDPHFRIEESGVLALLTRAGEQGLVQRALSEHAELRSLAAALEFPNAAALLRFAELMAAHVRFEERELFETVQTLFDTAGESPTAAETAFES